METRARRPLGRLGKIGLGGFVFLLAAFGVLVEMRSAFLTRRMGDLDVFLRAAWAVRTDADLYAVTSDNGWHYLYPPLYAILLTPLADPPPGQDDTGYVPYAFSAGLCYLISLMGLFGGVHMLANALQERSDDPDFRDQPRFCRRWWALRMWPIVICMAPIGHTLMRGQVNLILLGILCAALTGWLRGRNFRAGLWLSLAICIKVIPAYLLIYPLWKRDFRGLAGCFAGLFVGLVAIPVAMFGPARAQTHYETYGHVFFGSFFRVNETKVLHEEILGSVNATESIGVRNALLNWTYPNHKHRPADLPMWGKVVYLGVGVALTMLTLWPTRGRRGADDNPSAGHLLAALMVLMAVFSPVCHSHYLLFCVPAVTCLLASEWRFGTTLRCSFALTLFLSAFFWTTFIAYLPAVEILKDRCASLFATLPLWLLATVQLWRARSLELPGASVQSWRLRLSPAAGADLPKDAWRARDVDDGTPEVPSTRF